MFTARCVTVRRNSEYLEKAREGRRGTKRRAPVGRRHPWKTVRSRRISFLPNHKRLFGHSTFPHPLPECAPATLRGEAGGRADEIPAGGEGVDRGPGQTTAVGRWGASLSTDQGGKAKVRPPGELWKRRECALNPVIHRPPPFSLKH